METKPLVTVLMNCRNEGKLISNAINSVLNQTYNNLELIIWDDASSDNTIETIESFKDNRITVFKNKNHLGLGPSRCKAQKKINGDFVAILDADDEMKPNRIEKQLEKFKMDEKLALLGSNVTFKNAEGKSIINKQSDDLISFYNDSVKLKNEMMCRNIFYHSSIMYRKSFAISVGWYSDKLEYSQDYDLSLKLIKNFNFKVLKEALTVITLRNESMTESRFLRKTRLEEYLCILKQCRIDFKMDKTTSNINLRAILFAQLKLDLISDIGTVLKFIKIIKMFIRFPSILTLLLKKINEKPKFN